MASFTERDGITILSGAIDPENDPLSVTRINGDASLIDVPVPLSIGGSVTVSANGTVVFDDTGFQWPFTGQNKADGVIAEISDGHNTVSVAVALQMNNFG